MISTNKFIQTDYTIACEVFSTVEAARAPRPPEKEQERKNIYSFLPTQLRETRTLNIPMTNTEMRVK